MNSLPPDDSRLEALLRHDGSDLPDDGFTLRVVRALPPRRSGWPSRRLFCCVLGAGTGVALALRQGAAWPSEREMSAQVTAMATQASAFGASPWSMVAVAVVAAAAFWAWRSGEGKRA
jgi:hypothetical protein